MRQYLYAVSYMEMDCSRIINTAATEVTVSASSANDKVLTPSIETQAAIVICYKAHKNV